MSAIDTAGGLRTTCRFRNCSPRGTAGVHTCKQRLAGPRLAGAAGTCSGASQHTMADHGLTSHRAVGLEGRAWQGR